MRRLKVRLGEKARAGFPHSGLTSDVSASGLFVSTTANLVPGTRVHVEVTTAENQPVMVEGVVARQVIVPPELRSVVRPGVGVRFLTGTELMGELVPAIRDRAQVHFTYDSAPALREAWDRDLRHGGAFCWTDRAHPLNSILTVEIDLPFAGRRLAFEARVVHVVPDQKGKHGLAFMFLDVAGATAALEELVR